MGWFSQVTDFLSSPAFRIGAGVAGLASGAGAFSDMGGWGTALQGLSGAANLASGAASTFGPNRSAFDRATGALQLGLGGYNVGQSAGAVGTFGDVWNQLSGNGSRSGAVPGLTDSGSGAISGYPGYDESVTRTPLAPFSDDLNRQVNADYPRTPVPSQYNVIRPDGSIGAPPTIAQPTLSPSFRGGETITSSIGDVASDTSDLGWGQRAQITPADVPGLFDTPGLDAPRAPAPTPAPAPAPAPPAGSLDATPSTAPSFAPPGGAPTPTPATPPPTTPAAPTVDPRWGRGVGASTIQPVNPKVLNPPDWLDRTWTGLLRTAEQNPVGAAMQALQVGSMLTGLFAQSRADIAREAMAGMDPNSPNGAEFRRLFEERARKEIETQAATTRSSLEAKFAARGMLRSTVFTNAVQSLEDARIKLLADLPLTSLNAWNATPQGSGRALSAGASFAQATASPMDFSNMTRVLGQSPFTQQLAANAQQPAR